MRKLAVLGPKGTFSDSARIKYINKSNEEFEIFYYNTIDETFYSLEDECDLCIIPIENTLDGFVQRTLDLLLEMDVHIREEIKVPVQFSLIANANSVEDIKDVFVQFKTNGQCRQFLDKLKDVNIITTQSNMESFNLVQKKVKSQAGIIPLHMYDKSDCDFKIKNVTDSLNNVTRFVVVEKGEKRLNIYKDKEIKVPMYIMPDMDRPGILFDMLQEFSINKINLVAIMSRPQKTDMGKYNFYIEINGKYDEKDKIEKALRNISKNYKIKILGFYSL